MLHYSDPQLRRTFRTSDIRGAGGNLYLAERTVRKGGIVTFDSNRYQHDDLLPYVGARVMVRFDGDDIWADGPVIIEDGRHKVCTIEKPLPQPKADDGTPAS